MMSFRLSFCATLGALALSPLAGCGENTGSGLDNGDDTDGSTDTGSDIDTDTDTDSEPNPQPARPLAQVYRVDPLSTPELTEVELEHLTDPEGRLVGDFARVRSCLPDPENGKQVPLDFGIAVNLTICHPASRVTPGADGTYLHVKPPASPAEDDGQFAELMMYHHMNVIHDYFRDVHGLTDRDHPLDAITNLQAHIDLCDEWTQIANAAFFPEGAFESLGLPISASDFDIDGDAIVFSGSTTKNFAYDASVIYHEYTHAMLGATRLNAVFLDEQGLNNLPGALNEAYADYFAGTITESSQTGNYALNGFEPMYICGMQLSEGGDMGRDMQVLKTCPHDLTAEVHADAEIFSSALWAIRSTLGQSLSDQAILAAVLSLTHVSDFEVAAQATIDAFEELGGEDAGLVARQAFVERGLLGCKRLLPIERLGHRGLPLTLEAASALSPSPFDGYIPSYLQYSFELPSESTGFELTLNLQSQSFSGAQPNVEVAFKPGDEPISYVTGMTAGSGRNNAALTLPVVDGKVSYTFTDEDGLPRAGSWVLSIQNRGDTSAVTAASLQASVGNHFSEESP